MGDFYFQVYLVLFLIFLINSTYSLPTSLNDIQILQDIYESLNGESWKWNETSPYPIWNFTDPLNSTNPCDPLHWQGVLCLKDSTYNYVKSLALPSYGLDGYLPTSIGNLHELTLLNVNDNHIIGPIPNEIGNLTKLQILNISLNAFTGTLPRSIGSLVALDDLDVDNNKLQGKIPSSLGSLSSLRYLDMDNNYFSGSIPSELQTMSKIVDLDLDKNRLTGTIPSSLSKLSSLMYLSLDTNHLTGSIPSELGAMTQLNVLLLQNNQLTGHLGPFLWQASNLSLVSLDISGNTLSGTIPAEIFLIPAINILSLSVNCFQGPLPTTICEARAASIIAMDSLSSASSCKHSWSLVFINRIFWRYFGGSYHSCITNLPHLVVLHLSGNGLKGTLGVIPPDSKIQNLSLTHNRLTGTLPKSFQQWPFLHLDLSVNRLTGEFLPNVTKAYSQPTCFGDTSSCVPKFGKISLAVNRLSGDIPPPIYNAKRVDILAENTFSCGHLPDQDPVVNYYTCGSVLLDIAMGAFGGVLLILIVAVFLVRISRHLTSSTLTHDSTSSSANHSLSQHICRIYFETREYILWNRRLMAFSLPNLQGFNDLMDQFLRGIILLSCTGIVLNVPTYVLTFRENGTPNASVTTHMWLYRWKLSLVFVRGTFPAIMLIIAWIGSVLLIGWILRTRIVKEGGRESTASQQRDSLRLTTQSALKDQKENASDRATIGNVETPPLLSSYLLRGSSLVIRALVNWAVVLTIHVLFVYLSASSEFTPGVNLVAQFCLGLFMLIWNNFAVPEIILKSDPNMHVWDKLSIRVLMLLCNTILVPCIATAFTRKSCFQHVITPPEKISAEYSYTECGFAYYNETSQNEVCLVPDDITIRIQPAEPPLIYNFQCGSDLLTDYIPVYIYNYSLLILLPIARYIWLWNIPINAFPGDSSSTLFVPSGIMFPDLWHYLPTDLSSDGEADEQFGPSRASPLHISSGSTEKDFPLQYKKKKKIPSRHNLWKPDSILSRLITHAAILLTFGVCSPVLSIAIVLAVIFSILEWKFILGRFCFRRFSTLLDFNPMEVPINEENSSSTSNLVAIDSLSGYCDVNGEERKSAVDYTFVCLEESLTGILLSTGKCLIMVVCTSSLFMAGFCWDMVSDREGWEKAIWAPILICSVPFLMVIYTSGTNGRIILRPRSESSLSVKNILLLRHNTLSSLPHNSLLSQNQ